LSTGLIVTNADYLPRSLQLSKSIFLHENPRRRCSASPINSIRSKKEELSLWCVRSECLWWAFADPFAVWWKQKTGENSKDRLRLNRVMPYRTAALAIVGSDSSDRCWLKYIRYEW